jgi:hypothetical protein
VGVQGVLNVAFTNDTQVTDDVDGCATEHHVVVIGKGLGGRNDNGVTGVDTEGVKVLIIKVNSPKISTFDISGGFRAILCSPLIFSSGGD